MPDYEHISVDVATTPDRSVWQMCVADEGDEKGILEFSDGRFRFRGAVDESAEIFLHAINTKLITGINALEDEIRDKDAIIVKLNRVLIALGITKAQLKQTLEELDSE